MFTGIVQNLGTLKSQKPVDAGVELEIHSTLSAKDLQKGTSIAVNGVCLTVENHDPETYLFRVTCVPETLKKTSLGQLKLGALLNLEPSLRVGDSMAGHFVLGHSDFTAEVLDPAPWLRLRIPQDHVRYFPAKGSVTVNGVSLTIAECDSAGIAIALIPETIKNTNLGQIQRGDLVNIEIDVLMRYLESLHPTL